MATRVTSIKPPCGYISEGITDVWLLDYADFNGFAFRGDDLYFNCEVVAVLRSGEFIDMGVDNSTKYNSVTSGTLYAHTLETFISDLSALTLENLHLGTKRRFVVVFKAGNGKYFTFGYEAGATLTFAGQTPESIGALVTLTCASSYPLFELMEQAFNQTHNAEFLPNFDSGAFCEIS